MGETEEPTGEQEQPECDATRFKCCKYNSVWSMVPFRTWGNTPEEEKHWHGQNNCDAVMGGPELLNCPYNCNDASGDSEKPEPEREGEVENEGKAEPERSFSVSSGSYNIPRQYACGGSKTSIWFPQDLDQGPFPIASFGHGSGGGMATKWIHDVVRLGFVVVAPRTGNCNGHGMDIVHAISWSKEALHLHKALEHVDQPHCNLWPF